MGQRDGLKEARISRTYKFKCVEVQADGDELAYILTNFRNLPYVPGKSVNVWKGEMAQFIYDNL